MFTDSTDHARQKIIIENNHLKQKLIFYYEKNYLFDHINVGDSLVKEKGELFLKIYDSGSISSHIWYFKFDRIKDFKKYPEILSCK